MIVNPLPSGWEIIFQRHHALLAAKIAEEMKFELRPVYWTEMLTAITEHDDGQRDWHEGSFLDEQGHPKDFTEYAYDLKHARQSVTEASYKSNYIWLLVSRHITTLYGDKADRSEALDDFLKKEKKNQQRLLKHLDLTEEKFKEHYQLLRWCDECSLALCKRQDEVDLGELNGTSYKLTKVEDFYTIDPWPFKSGIINLELEIHQMDQQNFKNNDDLFKALQDFPEVNAIQLRHK